MTSPLDEATWAGLMPVPPNRGRLVGKRIEAGLDLFIAIDHQGLRHALVVLPDLSHAITDEQSRGIAVAGRKLQLDGTPERPYLDVVCTDRNAHQMFMLVVSDIGRRLKSGAEPARAVQETLARWRRFWGKAPSDRLTLEQVQGLFGELWFLKVWLLPHSPVHVNAWTGPTGSRHDFQWSDKAVEVKTTTSGRHAHVINGLEQLETPGDIPLYLFSLRVREEPTASNSLVTLIEALGSVFEGFPDLLEVFENHLILTGYSPAHTDHYRGITFRVMDERLYQVGDGFPRLLTTSFAGGLPPGVEHVRYSINLDVCPELCIGRSPTSPGVSLAP